MQKMLTSVVTSQSYMESNDNNYINASLSSITSQPRLSQVIWWRNLEDWEEKF